MSNRQKGLHEAFEALQPDAKQHHCLWHLHDNVKSKGYRGKAIKDELESAARACTHTKFDYHMKVIKGINPDCFAYLDKMDLKGWSKHAFRTVSKCDTLLNTIAKSFNSWIKDATDKPFLNMLEQIRRQLRNRFVAKWAGIQNATWTICPRIRAKLERAESNSRFCLCRWTDGHVLEVEPLNYSQNL